MTLTTIFVKNEQKPRQSEPRRFVKFALRRRNSLCVFKTILAAYQANVNVAFAEFFEIYFICTPVGGYHILLKDERVKEPPIRRILGNVPLQ